MKWGLSLWGAVCLTLSLFDQEAVSHMYISGLILICTAFILHKLEEK